jgi:hypothetical protein
MNCQTCQTCKHFRAYAHDSVRRLGGRRGLCTLDECMVRSQHSACRHWSAKRRPTRIRIARRPLGAIA